MPNYDYHCPDCGQSTEMFQKITAEPISECPFCGSRKFKRGPGGGIGLAFQGSGFYITDYAEDKKPCKEACPCAPENN